MKTDNEIIAEFMDHDVPKEYLNGSDLNNTYKNSWDWLMPVVEKISQHVYEERTESDGDETLTHKDTAFTRTFGMTSYAGMRMVRINRSPLFEAETLIEASYLAVVDWIQRFNETKSHEQDRDERRDERAL